MIRIGIHDISLDNHAKDLHAETQERDTDIDDEPVETALRGPAIEQEANGRDEQTRQQHRHSVLWPRLAACLLLKDAVEIVHRRPAQLGAEDLACANGDVVQTADGNGFVVHGRVEGGVAREGEVEEAVAEAAAEGLDLDDWVEGEEAEGPRQTLAEGPEGGAVGGVGGEFGVVAGVAGLLAELGGAFEEEQGRVGFPDDGDGAELDDDVRDGRGPEHPAPGGVLDYEAPDDGADGCAGEGDEEVETHCSSSFVSVPDVGQDTIAEREDGTAT